MHAVKPLLMLVLTSSLLMAGLAYTSPAPIIAQAPPVPLIEPSSPMERLAERAIAALGPLMLLGWYLYHTQTKSFPAKDQAIADAAAAFRGELASLREEHSKNTAAIVAEHHEFVAKWTETLMEFVRHCPATQVTVEKR